ncbi:MAG: hypothetical protein NTX79_02220 [Candidatus Micrarchaeota archaeon]|nr:hypothetical protein [Candidatus Micrarchaeota archaeon]
MKEMTFMSRTFVGKTVENYKLLKANSPSEKPGNVFKRIDTALDTLASVNNGSKFPNFNGSVPALLFT